jgi:hypothetical protein
MLAACTGVSSGHDMAGRYHASWDQREQLVLNADNSYQRTNADGSVSNGMWLLATRPPDTRLVLQPSGGGAEESYSARRGASGEVVVVLSAEGERNFVKVD